MSGSMRSQDDTHVSYQMLVYRDMCIMYMFFIRYLQALEDPISK